MTIPPKAQSGDVESAEEMLTGTLYLIGGGKSWGYDRDDATRDARAILSAIRERMLGEKAVEAAARALNDAAAVGGVGNIQTSRALGMARAALAAAVGALGLTSHT